jgi:hypothetical protein
MENHDDLYYQHRARFNALVADGRGESSEAAALFYYLNRTGYNGLCRFNKKGAFNVPFGCYQRIVYERDFAPYRTAFRSWTFTAGDFEAVSVDPDDFVYADPPYESGTDRRLAVSASWSSGPRQPGDPAHRPPLLEAWFRLVLPRRAAANQLHGRSDTCAGSHCDAQCLSCRASSLKMLTRSLRIGSAKRSAGENRSRRASTTVLPGIDGLRFTCTAKRNAAAAGEGACRPLHVSPYRLTGFPWSNWPTCLIPSLVVYVPKP